MINWQRAVAQVAAQVEDHFDTLKFKLEQRLGLLEPIQILTYLGHGDRERLHLKGRVLRNKGITRARDNDTVWENLHNMYRRFESDEVRFARVWARWSDARFGDTEQEVTANEEGFFEVHLTPAQPLPTDKIRYQVDLELVAPAEETPVRTTGQVIVPPPDAEFGVISDIDDTVIRTDAFNLLAMARNVYLHNAHTRLPFEGVAALYRALQAGTRGSYNPIYYVSSSPWNLYDLLVDFFDIRGIPLGPLFLADWGCPRTGCSCPPIASISYPPSRPCSIPIPIYPSC
jgi:phosphatidate phosphatase APP1